MVTADPLTLSLLCGWRWVYCSKVLLDSASKRLLDRENIFVSLQLHCTVDFYSAVVIIRLPSAQSLATIRTEPSSSGCHSVREPRLRLGTVRP